MVMSKLIICLFAISICTLTEQQELDLSTMSDKDIEVLLSQIMKMKETNKNTVTEKCKFDQNDGYIIKASESIENGAIFLTPASLANTTEACQNDCCSHKACNFAVFQSVVTSTDKDGVTPTQCYLFNCTGPDGEFACKTAKHTDYVTFTRDLKFEHVNDLVVIASHFSTTKQTITRKTTTLMTTTTKAFPPSSTTEISTISTSRPTTSTTTSTTPTTTVTTTTLPPSVKTLSSTSMTTTTSSSPVIELQASAICLMKMDKGQCDKKVDRFYFDIDLNSCEKFAFSGCGGNENNFESVELCQQTCDEFFTEYTDTDESVILPLALGLTVTASVLLMVACRLHVMKKKLRYRGKPLSMDESDYLVNGMYL